MMNTCRKRRTLISAFAAMILITANSSRLNAQETDPLWLDDLSVQAQFNEDCEILYLMRFHEQELGAQVTQEARIQCSDGRQFDVHRTSPEDRFTFKRCEVQTC